MLTARENFLETLRGGSPDRYVNQYEALSLIMSPIGSYQRIGIGGEGKNHWGVTIRWPEGTPGAFPVHDDAHKVVKDITCWRDTVHAPATDLPEEAWERAIAFASRTDRKEKLAAVMIAPGVFETCHYLMGMEDTLINFYEEPEAMHDLVEFITQYEMRMAEQICARLHPDAVFHHDDWGSHLSSFLAPEMFREFYLEPYQRIYGYYKAHGVEVIVHHSDSYAANLVPSMIEMGIDVWQGAVTTNDIPSLLAQYGSKLTIMGGLNNGILDKVDWTPEAVAEEVERMCRSCGNKYFIPCLTSGLPGSTYPGVYQCVSENIDRMSKLLF